MTAPARTILQRAGLAALGGAVGTALRLLLGLAVPDAVLAVLCANVLGALALGALSARMPASDLRILLGTGLLGGFTTYSALAVGAFGLAEDAPWLAAAYTVGSVVLGLLAAAAGLHWGRRRDAA